MRLIPIQATSSFLIILTLLSSCSSIREYATFAEAGSEYSSSLNDFLKCSGDVEVDAKSENILNQDRRKLFSNNALKDFLKNENKNNLARLQAIQEIRKQMNLLKEYFRLLAVLAGSDETIPGEVNKSITNITNSITTVTNSIQSNPIFPNNNLGTALGGFAELIVSSKIKSEVREELDKRKELLKEVFVTHKLMVKSLMMQVDRDLKLIATIRSQYLLETELLKPDLPSPSTWISNRKKIINIQKLIWDLKQIVGLPITKEENIFRDDNSSLSISELDEELNSTTINLNLVNISDEVNEINSIFTDFESVFRELLMNEGSLTRINNLKTKIQNHRAVFKQLCTYEDYKQALKTIEKLATEKPIKSLSKSH